MSDILAIEDLSFSYPGRKVVDRVSFQIRRGELFGLLGPNGAGKTTTISCIAGLLTSYEGRITLGGELLAAAVNTSHRASLGLVPQEVALYDDLTALENLRLFAELTGVPRKDLATRVSEMIEFAGLEGREKDFVRNYSGGMKRRLNLVAGVIHSPQLLILDEPTVGVDPQSRNHLFDSLLTLKQKGMSLLYTTHYMEEAQRLCDRVAVMNEGKIIAVGTRRELADGIGDATADLEKIFLQLTGRSLRDE